MNSANGCIEENNRNKYLTIIPTNESKDMSKKYEEIWSKTKDLVDQQIITQMIMIKNI